MKYKNNLHNLLKRDLFIFLLNPLTYFSALFFLLTTAFYFFVINDFFSLTHGSTDLRSFFSIIPYVSILVIPTLTMGLWEKEYAVSLHLPISTIHLVLSKWLSAFIVFLVFFSSSLFITVVISFFGSVDFQILISSIIGIILFSSSVIALGQVFTILFKHQASAFFSTSVFLSFFTFGSFLFQNIASMPTFIKSFFNFFSFTWHFDAFSKGIIDTRGVVFYCISTSIFIIISIFLIEYRKFSTSSTTEAKSVLKIRYIGWLLLSLVVLWNSQLFYVRFDVTSTQRFSLSNYSKDVISTVDSNISLTYYVSQELIDTYPHINDIKDFLYAYSSESSNIQVLVKSDIDVNIEKSLNSLGVMSQNIPSVQANRTSIISAYSGIVLEYKGFTEVIPFVFDTSTLEFDILGRIQSLTGTLNRSAFIVVGNGLTLDNDYPLVVPILENAGFSVLNLEPNDLLNISLLDLRTPLVILGSSNFTAEHVDAIHLFIDSGGSVLFSVSPIDVDLDTWVAAVDDGYFYGDEMHGGLFSLLKTYGINIRASLLHDSNSLNVTLLSQSGQTETLQYPFFIDIAPKNSQRGVALTDSFKGLSLLWPSPINDIFSINEFIPLIFTSKDAWLQEAHGILHEQSQSPFVTNPFFRQNLEPLDEKMNEYVVAAQSNNVIVVSDQYFLSRALSYIESDTSLRNFDFLINTLLVLQKQDEIVTLKGKQFFDYSLHKVNDDVQLVEMEARAVQSVLFYYILSIGIAPICVLVIRTQKKKRY